MKVYQSIEEFKCDHDTVVTIGTFDGVHIGHKVIIEQLKNASKKHNCESVILTFFPHPRMILYPDDHELKLINTINERIQLLKKQNIDHLIIHPFSSKFSKLSYTEFVRDVLVNTLNVSTLIIGYDHHFGRHREGTYEQLIELAPLYSFEVEEIPAQEIEQVNISSTKIRNAISSGYVEVANQFLGYSYFLRGKVVKGNQVGRMMGFPTANIDVEEKYKLIPAKGVYAVKVYVRNEQYLGMLNIGNRPTINESNEVIEVNILNFNDNIYDEEILIEFYHRIRDEIRFENVSALKEQIKIDQKKTIEILS